jgi:hypothetical protein
MNVSGKADSLDSGLARSEIDQGDDSESPLALNEEAFRYDVKVERDDKGLTGFAFDDDMVIRRVADRANLSQMKTGHQILCVNGESVSNLDEYRGKTKHFQKFVLTLVAY